MSVKVGRLIGESIGEVEEVDAEEDRRASGEYLRIRVKVDISKPLMRGQEVNLGKLGTH